MSNRLLEKLELKIDDVIETIEILRLQVEELEEKNATLVNENTHLKSRQSQWEQGLTTLLNKLDDVSPDQGKPSMDRAEHFETEELEEMA